MSFPRYPKCKESGVEWLGEVPEHWDVNRLKRMCNVFPSNVDKKCHDGETPVVLCNYTDVYYNERITTAIEFMAATASPDQIAKFTLRSGDTIITKDSETADDIAIAAYVPEDLPGVVCGYHLSMVRPLSHVCGAFVKWLFGCVYAKSRFATLANGLTRVGLGQYELDNVLLPFPPFAEQALIASFLDRETAKLDELVSEQKRLIELLKEKRQAVISHAVTKGLKPDAAMKPSGIEWLGDIPEHWTVTKLGRFATVTKLTGFEYTNHWAVDPDGEIIALRGYNIKGGKLNLDNVEQISRVLSSFLCRSKLRAGDIVFPCTGSVGDAAIIPEDNKYHINQNIAKITFDEFVTSEFALCFLFSDFAKQQFELLNTSGVQPVILIGNIRGLMMVVPDVNEQREIATYVLQSSERLDALIAESRHSIQLLQERRTALISAAVTGKIDVRGLAQTEAA